MNETFSSIEYNGVTYEVEDESKSGIYTVIGTQTAATKDWTGTINVPALYDGITIAYYLPYASTSSTNVTLNLTLADSTTTTGAIPVYFSGTTRMGVQYEPGSTIVLTYWSSGSISVNGTATTTDRWTHADYYQSNTDTVPTAICITAAATAAKTATCSNYSLLSKSYLPINITKANTAASALTLNVNATGAKPIYINGVASSSNNHTLPAGTYIAYYDGTNYQFRTDGVLPGKVYEATKVNGHFIYKDVPNNAVFTDTTYTASTASIGSASTGTAIPADDITAWNAGTLPSLTVTNTNVVDQVTVNMPLAQVSEGVLSFTEASYNYHSTTVGSASNWNAGTAPSLSYTAKSIPNVSVTSKTVVTGITAN